MKRVSAAVLLAGAVLAAGCRSPEASRTRGGGPGADPGNRPADVLMHEGSRQYWETPVLIPGDPMPLDPAHQARQLSLPSRSSDRTPAGESPQPGPSGGGDQ